MSQERAKPVLAESKFCANRSSHGQTKKFPKKKSPMDSRIQVSVVNKWTCLEREPNCLTTSRQVRFSFEKRCGRVYRENGLHKQL